MLKVLKFKFWKRVDRTHHWALALVEKGYKSFTVLPCPPTHDHLDVDRQLFFNCSVSISGKKLIVDTKHMKRPEGFCSMWRSDRYSCTEQFYVHLQVCYLKHVTYTTQQHIFLSPLWCVSVPQIYVVGFPHDHIHQVYSLNTNPKPGNEISKGFPGWVMRVRACSCSADGSFRREVVHRWAEKIVMMRHVAVRGRRADWKNTQLGNHSGITLYLYYKTAVIRQVVLHSQTLDLRHNV